MVERHVVVGHLLADPGQARLEVLQVAPRIPVVGAEARQVDVGQEEHAARDAETAVAAGVPGEVHRLDRHPAEIEDVPVGEALRIGSWGEVELLDDRPGEEGAGFAAQPVHVHQSVDGDGAGPVRLVDVDTCRREEPVARHVVLVAVAVQDRVDGEWCTAAPHDRDGGVDQHDLARTPDQERVARGVGARSVALQHADGVGQPQFVLAPVDDARSSHESDATAPPSSSRFRAPMPTTDP